jgi:hypothetical protein
MRLRGRRLGASVFLVLGLGCLGFGYLGVGCTTRPVTSKPPSSKAVVTGSLSDVMITKVDLLFAIDN